MKNNTKGVKNKNKIEKDNKSGIIITKEIKVTPYSCENLPVSIAILQNIFIILVVASTIYCFTDRFINDISKFKLNLWIVLITVVVYQLCLINRRSRNRWPLLGFITTSIVIGFLNFNNLKNSALLVLDKFICYFDSYYNTSNYVSLNDVTQNNNTTDIFIAIAVLMILVISYCVTCYMSKGIYFTVTLPFICICFLVGYVPATFPFYIYIASTFAIWSAGIIKGNYCVKDSKIAKKNNVKQKNFKDIAAVKIGQTIFIVISIMFIISFILFPKKNFNDKNYVTELRNTVQQKFDDSVNNIFVKLTGKSLVNGKTSGNTEAIFNKIGFNSKDPGGISGGTLGKTDGIEFKNTSKLKVTSTLVNDTIYLKGFVGIEYNNGWEKYSDSTDILKESSIENHSFKSAKQLDNLFQYGILSVENISEKTIRDTLIVPYASEITTNIAENGYIMSEEDNTTSYYLYTFDDIVNKVDSLKEKGLFDGNYVDESQSDNATKYCVEVPDLINETINEIKEDIEYQEGELSNINDYESGSYDKFINTVNTVNSIRDYMNNNYFYELLPGKVPSGKEPVEYFLKESKKGYCMYFAAASTALFRACGIPSRYVEGYIVTEADFDNASIIKGGVNNYKEIGDISKLSNLNMYEMEIKDTNAHAWTEIYIDGLGWVPVEVTGSSIVGENVTDYIQNSYASSTPKPTVEPIQNNSQTNKPVQNSNTIKNNETMPDNQNSDKNEMNILVIVVIVLVLIVVILIVISIFITRKKRITNKFDNIKESQIDMVKYMANVMNKLFNEDNIAYKNDMAYYDYAKQISDKYQFISEEDAVSCISLIIKECFSKDGVTRDEYNVICQFYNYYMENTTKNWSKYKLWYYKNIECIKFNIFDEMED